MNALIEYNDDAHEYRVNGEVVPSVTQVIKSSGLVDYSHCTEYGRKRGTIIHEVVQLINEGDLDEDSVDPLIRPWISAYRAFLSDCAFRLYRSEMIVHSELYGYAGRFDMYGRVNKRRAIIDVKTGQIGPDVEWQLGAYMQAAKECGLRPQTAFSLQLRPDGTYRLREHRNGFIAFRQFLK